MFVNSYVVTQKRGSEFTDFTVICSSLEYHRSFTTCRSRLLPICPCGMVIVLRVPCAITPFCICCPSSSTLVLLPAFPSTTFIWSGIATHCSDPAAAPPETLPAHDPAAPPPP